MNLQIVLNTPKNPFLNQAAEKNACQNFPTQKNPKTKNFKPKNILSSFLLLEIWSTSSRVYNNHTNQIPLNKV